LKHQKEIDQIYESNISFSYYKYLSWVYLNF
jgi:hypothetical protein